MRPLHDCLEWAGRVVEDVTDYGGELTLEQAKKIISAAHAEMMSAEYLRVTGLDRTGRGRGQPFKDPAMLAVFLAIEQELNAHISDEDKVRMYLGEIPGHHVRFAPYKNHTDQNVEVEAAYDAYAALFEGVCRALGLEILLPDGRNRCVVFVRGALKDFKARVNGRRKRGGNPT